MKRAASMSYMDGCVGTWPKEKRLVSKVKAKVASPEQMTFFELHMRRQVCNFLVKLTPNLFLSSSLSSSSRGISFEIPLDGDPTMPISEVPSLRGMTRSASSDGLGFKVHYARGGMKRHLSLMPVNNNINGQSRHIPEEDETSHKPLGRNNTFSIKNQSRCRWMFIYFLF